MVTDQFIAYTKSLSKYFLEHFKALGGEILLEDTYTNGDNDFLRAACASESAR